MIPTPFKVGRDGRDGRVRVLVDETSCRVRMPLSPASQPPLPSLNPEHYTLNSKP